MKTAVASAMALILLSVIALCPLIICPLNPGSEAVSHACCHKSQSHPTPSPTKQVPDCPYSILAKSKTNAGAYTLWTAVVAQTSYTISVPELPEAAHADYRLVDSTGLFLRNRVLLI